MVSNVFHFVIFQQKLASPGNEPFFIAVKYESYVLRRRLVSLSSNAAPQPCKKVVRVALNATLAMSG